jgi:outer membrane biosynthesis protein TonB
LKQARALKVNGIYMTSDKRIGKRNGGNTMKLTGIITTAAFFALLGIAVPANARQEKQKESAAPAKQEQQAKPEKQQQAEAPKQQPQHQQQQAQAPKQQQAKAPKQEQQAKPEKQQQAKAPKQEQQAKPEKQQQAKAPQQQQAKGQQQQAKGEQQSRSAHAPQRTQQAVARQRAQPALRLSERGSGRIPEERFRSNFGHEHSFRMGNPVLVGGYSRFQYSGFWFGFVEPWPAGWYYTDDVYIDYVDGGYYMYNPYYPGARFAISVVL